MSRTCSRPLPGPAYSDEGQGGLVEGDWIHAGSAVDRPAQDEPGSRPD